MDKWQVDHILNDLKAQHVKEIEKLNRQITFVQNRAEYRHFLISSRSAGVESVEKYIIEEIERLNKATEVIP